MVVCVFSIGLCNDCINQTARDMPPPTPGDLQGFWEMVLLQVDNVDSLYADLDKIRANGWKVSAINSKKLSFAIFTFKIFTKLMIFFFTFVYHRNQFKQN